MKFKSMLAARLLAASALLLAAPAAAAPTPMPVATANQTTIASVPFAPPIGEKLRLKLERTIEQAGKSEMNWAIADYQFEPADDGYRLTVTPIASGNGKDDPISVAIYKKLAELTRLPYSLAISEDGVITGMENADFYWQSVLAAIEEAVAENDTGAKPLAPGVKAALSGVIQMFGGMTAEARLALLTDDIQPLLEFTNTEWDAAEPVSAQIDAPGLFGGTFKRDVRIALASVDGDVATLTLHSEIPRSELDKLTSDHLGRIAQAAGSKLDKDTVSDGISGLDRFTHETRARYEVSLVDGLVIRYRSAETIEAIQGDTRDTRVTTRSLDRIE